MIDIEYDVFNAVATSLRSTYSGIYVTSEYSDVPASFPAVYLTEDDNYTYTKTMDTSYTENHAQLMYSVNVYSNLESGAKAQCKTIMASIDALMLGLGFIRTACNGLEVQTTDLNLYRMVARYRAVVSSSNIIYRR